MRRIKTVTGIGDTLWFLQKLINTNEKFDFLVANEDPNQRARQILSLLPQLINSVNYGNFTTQNVFDNNIQNSINKWSDIKDEEFYLSINHHLEAGKRIELFLEDLPVTFDMRPHLKTLQYTQETDTLLNTGRKYIGLYMSSYSTNRHWGFWNEAQWFELAKYIETSVPGKVTFVIIGASYDLDLATSLINHFQANNYSFINTVGKNLGFVCEVMKKLNYGFYFPSGIGILAASLYSPHTMFFPNHLDLMRNSFQAPELIKNNMVYHSKFVSPKEMFDWYTNVYKGLEKI